jgi:hypothetical protein
MKEAVVNELSFLNSPKFELPVADDLVAGKPLMKNFVVCGMRVMSVDMGSWSSSPYSIRVVSLLAALQ